MHDDVALPDFGGFDWSGGNAEKNWERHRVTPLEAEQVYFNRPLITAQDLAHSSSEARYYVLGQTDGGRRLFVVFTLRQQRIRVISARDMSKKERKVYGT